MRVELGEVEHALSELPSVELAIALVRSDPGGAQCLVAYVTPAAVDTAEAIAAVRPRLPAHMVPSVVVPLQRMPLLPNGKIDRKVARCPGSPKLADPLEPLCRAASGRPVPICRMTRVLAMSKAPSK